MTPIVGVFQTRTDAEGCSATLVANEIGKSKIHLLTPNVSKEELASVPTIHAEEPGIGKALGAVVGGAMGLAGGGFARLPRLSWPFCRVWERWSHWVFPGAGLLTALGAFGGGAVGGALENSVFKGLPDEELFVYRDALRMGRSVLIVTPDNREKEERTLSAKYWRRRAPRALIRLGKIGCWECAR